MALDTATGDTKSPIIVAYSAALNSNKNNATINTTVGIIILELATIRRFLTLSFKLIKLNNPPRVISAIGVDAFEIKDNDVYKNPISLSLKSTLLLIRIILISSAIKPKTTPMINGFFTIFKIVDLKICLLSSLETNTDSAIVAKIFVIGIETSATNDAVSPAASPPIAVARGIPIIA